MGFQSSSRAQNSAAAKSGRGSKRSKAEYLTHPKAIQFMANTVDQALTAAKEQGDVTSFDDVKEAIESYSAENTRHPLTVEMCEIDGAVRGMRLHFQADPAKTITGKHLALKTGQPADTYTPSAIARFFEFDESRSEAREDWQETPTPRGRSFDADDVFDGDGDDVFSGDTGAFSGDSDDAFGTEVVTRPTTPLYQNALGQIPDASNGRDADDDDFADAATDFNEGEGEVGARSNQRRRRLQTSRNLDEKVIQEMDYVGRRGVTQGSDLNGANLAGIGLQGAALVGANAKWIAEALENESYKYRAGKLLEDVQAQGERVGLLGKRLEAVTQPTATPEQASNAEDPFLNSLNQLGKTVNRLGEQAASATQQTEKPLPPVQFDARDDIGDRLDKLEEYLKKLTQKIDRLEARIDKLEALMEQGLRQEVAPQVADLKQQRMAQQGIHPAVIHPQENPEAEGAAPQTLNNVDLLDNDREVQPAGITPKQQALGRKFVERAQAADPEAFAGESGTLVVDLLNQDPMEFAINRNEDDSQSIVGAFASAPDQPVFEGTIQPDGFIRVNQADLPDETLESLGNVGVEPKTPPMAPPQPNRSRSKGREL